MSETEILVYLRKLLGKYRKVEGIYVFPKPMTIFTKEYTLSVNPVETEVLDLRDIPRKIFFLINKHDVNVYVDIMSSYSPTGDFVSVRENPIKVDSESIRLAVSVSDPLVYVKARMWTQLNPSKGYFTIIVLGYSL